ncbi:MAG: glutamine amidotransferase [Actinomycetota bacterium]|nr:glutamine amidotransferase [Actinomycetota bacterium]
MPRDSAVGICLLLPDVLGTYSDAGNATVLSQRLRWRGIHTEVMVCTVDKEPPTSCDIYLLGGGEDIAQLYATDWMLGHQRLCQTIGERALTLAVCAGMQILGRSMTDPKGRCHPGVGLLDISTEPRRRRAIGEIVTNSSEIGVLTGFENHRGATTLGSDATPLGQVVSGIGNGDARFGRARADGARTEHVIATYMHGPVLARNPALADYILAKAIRQPLTEFEVPDQHALRASYLP